MRSNYKIYHNECIHFITSTIIEWIPVFTSQKYFDILIASMSYCREEKNLSIFAYVILDDHFHAVCQAPELSKTIQSLKRHTAKCILDQLEKDHRKWMLNLFAYYKKMHKTSSEHQVWQDGFHPQEIMNEEMLVNKIEYIHYNPVRRGLVKKPKHWIFSSAADYGDGHGVLEIGRLEF